MTPHLQSPQPRARWMRLDTAQILKRFYFCERALVLGASAWLPHIAPLGIKTTLPLFTWQNAETAHALRERVFELRYPSRLLEEEGADRPLAELFGQLQEAPSAGAFLHGLGTVLLPALRAAYGEFLQRSDALADAPTHRFLALSFAEKAEQIKALTTWAEEELGRQSEQRFEAMAWARKLSEGLTAIGGVSTEHAPADRGAAGMKKPRPLPAPARPARDPRYWPCRFYWPDNVDPAFPYGDGVRLQLRSAVSHLNEVWAVETGGIILGTFADVLPWEWIRVAARWTYDEARHCRMGQDRLESWRFAPAEIPLGTYIYEAASGEDPIYRLGMLFFFETKNIGRKPERIAAFQEMRDSASEHDMDFDWADETIHASYGKRWLEELLKRRGDDPSRSEAIRVRCSELVAAQVRSATANEIAALRGATDALLAKAERLSQPG